MDHTNLYGQKDLAEFCEFVVASLFQVAPTPSTSTPAFGKEGIDTPPYTPPTGSSPSNESSATFKKPEPPLLVEFIAYALYRTRLPNSIVHQSLLLLSRLKQRYPSARGTSSSPHRLFLSSLMLSAKISMDDTYSNKSWAIVGSNYFALKEVNQMERELFAFLGWNVVATKEELDAFILNAEASWEHVKQARLSESRKRRRMEEEHARHQQAKNAARALLRPHTYRHQSPSPSGRSLTSRASSRASSAAASPYQSPHHTFNRMQIAAAGSSASCSSSEASSSRGSSAFPSASHSPTSPASAPLSAGPQTPDTDHMDIAPCPQIRHGIEHHEIPDFPEAATYVSSKSSKPRNFSPHSTRGAHERVPAC